MLPDYYKILNIPPDADDKLIKRAYYQKAKVFHPDINKSINSKQQFQILNEAYQTLINAGKRKVYDFKLKYGKGIVLKKSNAERDRERSSSYTGNQAKSNTQSRPPAQETLFNKGIVDKFLFFTMAFFGILAIVFGTLNLFASDTDDYSDINSIVFGIAMILILYYGWKMIVKRD